MFPIWKLPLRDLECSAGGSRWLGHIAPCRPLAPSSPAWISQARLLLRFATMLPDSILTALVLFLGCGETLEWLTPFLTATRLWRSGFAINGSSHSTGLVLYFASYVPEPGSCTENEWMVFPSPWSCELPLPLSQSTPLVVTRSRLTKALPFQSP